jgi:hypothetical protein
VALSKSSPELGAANGNNHRAVFNGLLTGNIGIFGGKNMEKW